ncbi:hypothetical protein AAMO2058_000663500 [Amorphochlora amoebiformis]
MRRILDADAKRVQHNLSLRVVSYLDPVSLGRLCCVCRAWQSTVDEPSVWKRMWFRSESAKRSSGGFPVLQYRHSWKETVTGQTNTVSLGYRSRKRKRVGAFESGSENVLTRIRSAIKRGVLSRIARPIIEESSSETLSMGEFTRKYLKKSRREPLIIRQAMREFTERISMFQMDKLVHLYGSREFHINAWGQKSDVRMTLENFAHYLQLNHDRDPLYLFDPDVPKEVMDACTIPRFFTDDILHDLNTRQDSKKGIFTETGWLLIGGGGSGTKLHFDPHAVSAWSIVTQGQKLWFTFPPPPLPHVWGHGGLTSFPPALDIFERKNHEPERSGNVLDWISAFLLSHLEGGGGEIDGLGWGVQGVGDIVYVPRGWYHLVVNLSDGPTVSYTRWFVPRRDIRLVARTIEDYDQDSAKALREEMLQRLLD